MPGGDLPDDPSSLLPLLQPVYESMHHDQKHRIQILGPTTNFDQAVESMQIEHKNVDSVKPGDDFAMKVIEPVREQDEVYKVAEETA